MNNWVFLTTLVIFGTLIGSFLNVVIYRGPSIWGLLPEEASNRGGLDAPRSYCPSCKTTLRAIDLIPLLSYLGLKGRCRYCQAPIPPRYALIELTGAAAAVTSYLIAGPTLTALFMAVFLWSLIALGTIDWDTGYLPDAITLPLIWAGLLANLQGRYVPLDHAVIGAAAGYVIFRALGALYHRLRGREGLGQGDAKLLAAIGAWAGWTSLAPTVFIASFAALAWIAGASLFGKPYRADSEIAFGPFLAIGGAIALMALRPFISPLY